MKRIYLGALFFLHFVCNNNGFSQGFQVNFQGQRQQGMGLAGIAAPFDGSSLFFNPGSSVFLNQNSIVGGVTPVFSNILFIDSATNTSYRSNSPVGTPFSFYAMFQLKPAGKLKLGLSVNTPFGSTVQYEDNWIGRFALTRLELKAIFIQPTFAYRIADHIGIGGGFVISSGNVNLQKDIPVQDTNGVYGHAELAGKAIGFGYNIGIHFNPSKQLSIGLTYRSKVAMNLRDGEATFTVPSSLEDKFPTTSFTGRLPLPSVTTLGFSYHPCSAFTVVLDINRVGWKVYDTLAFDYATNTSSLLDTKSPRMYKNIVAFGLGMEVKPTKNLALRIGGGYGLTPVQSGYVTPETPDGIRIYGTFGLGYELSQKIRVDASIYYTKIKRSDTNLETNMSGTYTTIALAPGLSIAYKW